MFHYTDLFQIHSWKNDQSEPVLICQSQQLENEEFILSMIHPIDYGNIYTYYYLGK